MPELRLPLLAMAGAFALGIGLEDALQAPSRYWLAPLAAAALLALGLPWALERIGRTNRPRARALGAGCAAVAELALGAALGGWALALRLHAAVPQLAAAGELVELRVISAARYALEACRADVWVLGAGRPGRARVWNEPALCAALPGERFLARAQLAELAPARNPGGADVRRSARRAGVRAQLRLASGALEPIHAAPGWRQHLAALRGELAEVLDPSAPAGRGAAASPPAQRPAAGGPLLRALVTGDRSRLPAALQERFAAAGLAHVLAVSGFHVTLVFGLLRGLALLGLRALPWLPLLRAAPPTGLAVAGAGAAGYALLAGLEVPVLRAALMSLAAVFAACSGRPGAAANALGLAALAVLALEPGALFSPGFLLSFGAVAGILAWRPPAQAGALGGALHVSLAASAATAPWLAAFGLALPAGSLLANAAALPVFALLTALGLLGALVGWLLPQSAPWLGPPLRAAAELAVAGVGVFESPDALRWLPAPALPRAAALLCALFAARAAALRAPRAQPGALLALAGLLWLLSAALAPRAAGEHPSALFFDVGHGDAILLRDGPHAALIDAGDARAGFDAGRARVLPGLRALGVERLDALILSHADRDHAGGAAAVLAGLPVAELWLAASQLEDPALGGLRARAARAGVPLRLLSHGQRLRLGRTELAVAQAPPALAASGRNAASLVIAAHTPHGCALLPGDAPAEVERALAPALGPCALLKLAHHGSRTSSSAPWLAAAAPALAVLSAGRRPRSPLPHPSVAQRLAAAGIPWLSTEHAGAIEIEFAPGELRVRSWGSGEPRSLGAIRWRPPPATPRPRAAPLAPRRGER